MPRAKRKNLETIIRFRADDDLAKRIAAAAKLKRCSISHLVRDIAYQAIETKPA